MIRAEVPDARVVAFAVDVRDALGVQEAVDATVKQFGRLDVLVANAGATNAFDMRAQAGYVPRACGGEADWRMQRWSSVFRRTGGIRLRSIFTACTLL